MNGPPAVQWALLCGGVLCLLSPPLSAARHTPQEALRIARKHLKYAKADFERSDYATAAKQWGFAYKLKPEPALLFNMAQAFRLSGKYAQARRYYEQYLHDLPDAPNREETRRFLAQVMQKLAARRRSRSRPAVTAD